MFEGDSLVFLRTRLLVEFKSLTFLATKVIIESTTVRVNDVLSILTKLSPLSSSLETAQIWVLIIEIIIYLKMLEMIYGLG